jgi:hypothetical protein
VTGVTGIVQRHKGVPLPDGSLSLLHYTQILTFAGELIVDQRVEFDTLNFARVRGISLANFPA